MVAQPIPAWLVFIFKLAWFALQRRNRRHRRIRSQPSDNMQMFLTSRRAAPTAPSPSCWDCEKRFVSGAGVEKLGDVEESRTIEIS